MRGRKPSVLSLAPSDEDRLHTTAHSDSLPWYQVRRARILLALAAGQRKRDVAAQMECGVATVWRACERYRRDGLEGLLADGREGRSGRLEQITPRAYAPLFQGLRTTFSCVFEGFSRELSSYYIITTNYNALYSPIHYRKVASM
jgi:hypothetical protein